MGDDNFYKNNPQINTRYDPTTKKIQLYFRQDRHKLDKVFFEWLWDKLSCTRINDRTLEIDLEEAFEAYEMAYPDRRSK